MRKGHECTWLLKITNMPFSEYIKREMESHIHVFSFMVASSKYQFVALAAILQRKTQRKILEIVFDNDFVCKIMLAEAEALLLNFKRLSLMCKLTKTASDETLKTCSFKTNEVSSK